MNCDYKYSIFVQVCTHTYTHMYAHIYSAICMHIDMHSFVRPILGSFDNDTVVLYTEL